ncbi:CFI-box-CTERM domain-containing protein [Natronorubrum bangense]|uniref:Restriction system mrr-like protein n=1 Tax=Natronorubrum bangense JCM 10635 TaxID=1227500 RepID=L9VZL6_9EURY|nr:CFI-box-CTERM domain-containing protein [Natronorubrum bangense]ELY42694.1 restriction system mrr-like protein [Natronorubrum bangense JCM 10635]
MSDSQYNRAEDTDEATSMLDTKRRQLLKTAGVGAVGTIGLGTTGSTMAVASSSEELVSIRFQDRPDSGDDFVDVVVDIDEDYEEDSLEIRAFDEKANELTAEVKTASAGAETHEQIPLSEALEAGDFVHILLFEEGVNDPDEAIADGSGAVDETYIEFREQPAAGDDRIYVSAISSSDDRDELDIRVGDESDMELTTNPVSVGTSYEGPVELDDLLSEGDEITAVVQSDDEYNPEEADRLDTITVAEVETDVSILDRPDAGAEAVEISVSVSENREESLEIRAFRDHNSDLTAEVMTVEPGKIVDTQVPLTEPLEAGDIVEVGLLEEGVEDPQAAVADSIEFVNETHIEFRNQPTPGDDSVDVFAIVGDEDRELELEIRVSDESDSELTTEPVSVGLTQSASVELDEPLSVGEEITAMLQPQGEYDPGAAVRSATKTVEFETSVDILSPLDVGTEVIDVSVAVADDYDADTFEVRALEMFGDDLTAEAASASSGEVVETQIHLSRALEAGDVVWVALFNEGDDDLEAAIEQQHQPVDETHIEFQQPLADGDDDVWISAIVEQSVEDEVVVRIGDESGRDLIEDQIELGSGDLYDNLLPLTTTFSEGDEITAVIQSPGEYDPENALASATKTVEDTESVLTAEFTYSPTSPDVEDEVTFDGSDSGPTAEIEQYTWEFIRADGGFDIQEGKQVNYTFDEPGEHEVVLVVETADNQLAVTKETITVREGCFIATAACGTPDHEQVQTLRSFRDTTLKGNAVGELLIRCYYATSPPVADWVAESARRRSLVRSTIVRPAARLSSLLGLDGTVGDDTSSND